MRVALVCGTYAPERDGVADYVRRLAAELPAVGVQPVIASRVADGGGAAPGSLAVTPSWSARYAWRAARTLDRLGCDLVHVQFAPSAYRFSPAIGWLPAGLRTPLVTTLHEYGWWSWPAGVPATWWQRLERAGHYDRETGLLGPRSLVLVTTNSGHATAVQARLGRRPEIVPIAPNVPAPRPDRDLDPGQVRNRLGLPGGAPLLVFFGFVHPVKGVRELIDAVARLRDDGTDVHLVVAGGFTSLALPQPEADSFRAEVEQRIAERRVSDRVTITGWIEETEVSELLSAADAVVLPFTAGVTTKSGSLLAAFAHGVPVLATAADDPDPDLVDGKTVLTISRRRDPAAIVAALQRLLARPDEATAVARAGAAVASTRSWPSVAAAHAQLYARALRR